MNLNKVFHAVSVYLLFYLFPHNFNFQADAVIQKDCTMSRVLNKLWHKSFKSYREMSSKLVRKRFSNLSGIAANVLSTNDFLLVGHLD